MLNRTVLVFVGASMLALGGCAKPQEIEISSQPANVAVSIDDEFMGKTPLIYEIDNIKRLDKLRIKLEKQGFDGELITLRKKSTTGMFPERVHKILEPSMTAGEAKGASSGSSSSTSGHMMGPTIVVPGGGGATITPPTPPSN